jgi:SAM-dependent methyltransferase
MTERPALYWDLAEYYDRIYHWKDYRKEAEKVAGIVSRHKRSKGNLLLDVACGTGKHLQFLAKKFQCTGVDESERMLAQARRNSPSTFVRAGLPTFDLGKEFDVVLCLFSGIGYLQTRRDLRKASACFARHMKKGGVLIIEPWLRKSEWKGSSPHLQTYDGGSVKIARLNIGHARGSFSVLDEGYLVADKGKGIHFFMDRHRLRFFEKEFTLKALADAGLKARFTEDSLMPSRGLVIGTKPV